MPSSQGCVIQSREFMLLRYFMHSFSHSNIYEEPIMQQALCCVLTISDEHNKHSPRPQRTHSWEGKVNNLGNSVTNVVMGCRVLWKPPCDRASYSSPLCQLTVLHTNLRATSWTWHPLSGHLCPVLTSLSLLLIHSSSNYLSPDICRTVLQLS